MSDLGDRASGLSSRETEVLRLIVDVLTNAEIAAELYLTERTMHRHGSNILTKLGVRSRTPAAILAVQHTLTWRACDALVHDHRRPPSGIGHHGPARRG